MSLSDEKKILQRNNITRCWEGTLLMKKESGLGWSPLPDSGHVLSMDGDPYKEAYRCSRYLTASPLFGLITFGRNPELDKLLQIVSADHQWEWQTTKGEAVHDYVPYIILDLNMLLMIQKQTKVLDSIIEAIKSWREINRQVVLCLNYYI